MTSNMRETLDWLRGHGFTCPGCAHCRLLIAARGALAALSQPKTFPGDVVVQGDTDMANQALTATITVSKGRPQQDR